MTRHYFVISREETKQLVKMLEKEYISHEFFPLVQSMIKRANRFLSEDDELSKRTHGLYSGSRDS